MKTPLICLTVYYQYYYVLELRVSNPLTEALLDSQTTMSYFYLVHLCKRFRLQSFEFDLLVPTSDRNGLRMDFEILSTHL